MPPANATTDIETLVIGAGVVGLATAATLARAGHHVVVVERDKFIGQGISSRNSEVIHTGIYYTPESLKAKLCVRGRELLYKYCHERAIPCQRLGKFIVATETSEIETLGLLKQKALRNGVDDLSDISSANAMAMQPGLRCVAALHSPSTGIVDSHALMLSLQADIELHHGDVVCHTKVESIEYLDSTFQIHLADGSCVTAAKVINSSGLYSAPLARKITRKITTKTAAKKITQTNALNSESIPLECYAKGNYFKLSSPAAFSKLIYPAPVTGGLGIHLTIDLAAQKRFGPNVEWLPGTAPADLDYQVSADHLNDFYTAIRRYWPDLPNNSLTADYAGVRPKIKRNNAILSDFEISTENQHGVPGLVNLFGIESPGLTASLAIAEYINQVLK